MIKINFTVERKGALTDAQKKTLSDIYGKLWMEANYDPSSKEIQAFAKPLSDLMQALNKELRFKA